MVELFKLALENVKKNLVIVIILTIMACFMFFVWIQVFNHLPTQIKEVEKELKTEIKEVEKELKIEMKNNRQAIQENAKTLHEIKGMLKILVEDKK